MLPTAAWRLLGGVPAHDRILPASLNGEGDGAHRPSLPTISHAGIRRVSWARQASRAARDEQETRHGDDTRQTTNTRGFGSEHRQAHPAASAALHLWSGQRHTAVLAD